MYIYLLYKRLLLSLIKTSPVFDLLWWLRAHPMPAGSEPTSAILREMGMCKKYNISPEISNLIASLNSTVLILNTTHTESEVM